MFCCNFGHNASTSVETTAVLTIGGSRDVNSLGDYFFISAKDADMSGVCELQVYQGADTVGAVKFTTTRQTLCNDTTYLGDVPMYYTIRGNITRARFESFSACDITKGIVICVSFRNMPSRVYQVVFK